MTGTGSVGQSEVLNTIWREVVVVPFFTLSFSSVLEARTAATGLIRPGA